MSRQSHLQPLEDPFEMVQEIQQFLRPHSTALKGYVELLKTDELSADDKNFVLKRLEIGVDELINFKNELQNWLENNQP